MYTACRRIHLITCFGINLRVNRGVFYQPKQWDLFRKVASSNSTAWPLNEAFKKKKVLQQTELSLFWLQLFWAVHCLFRKQSPEREAASVGFTQGRTQGRPGGSRFGRAAAKGCETDGNLQKVYNIFGHLGRESGKGLCLDINTWETHTHSGLFFTQ